MPLTATQQRAAQELLFRRIGTLRSLLYDAIHDGDNEALTKIRQDRAAEWEALGGEPLKKANRYFATALKKLGEHADALRAHGMDVPDPYLPNPFMTRPSILFDQETENLVQKERQKRWERQHKAHRALEELQQQKQVQILEATLGEVEGLMDLPTIDELLANL